ncbi:MAG: response regulator [Sulfuricellaceae bacterium]|nr:response regulator [Sulfuricellaceae bacterium]
MNDPTRILLAEDAEIIASIIQDLLSAQGYEVTVCADGLVAWEHLQKDGPGYDVILLDRSMPHMDGMELLGRIKSDPAIAHIPVIMETAQADRESIREGLAQGAYYYLTKPFEAEVLLAVVSAALQQSRDLREMVESVRRAERPLALMQTGCFRFHNLDEGRLLANYLARACPEPERAIHGLQELLVNAVEHGNLAISYAEKGALLLEGGWQEEVQRRLRLDQYCERYVEIHFQRQPGSLAFTIQDQGDGFDWQGYLDFSPDRAFDLHGRGIAMARKLSFDHLEYRGNGNTVIATISQACAIPGSNHCP